MSHDFVVHQKRCNSSILDREINEKTVSVISYELILELRALEPYKNDGTWSI